MAELRWGRFSAGSEYLVWIDVRGPENKSWLWVNGRLHTDAVIGDDRIVVAGNSLVLETDRAHVLESEHKISSLAKSFARFLPGIKGSMTRAFLHAQECKWLSKASLLQEGKSVATGWAIHELVIFTDKDRTL